jgi:hypothetical protein
MKRYLTKVQPEITDDDLEELVRLVKEGYTSGLLDNGEGKHIAWTLEMNVWQDD